MLLLADADTASPPYGIQVLNVLLLLLLLLLPPPSGVSRQDVHDHLWSHSAAVWPHPILQEDEAHPRCKYMLC
jgi:hypothetical protein